MSPGGESEEANTFTGVVAKVELLRVFLVSRTGRKEYPSTGNKIAHLPPRGYGSPWVEVFAVVKANVPKSGNKHAQETKYFLGYEGDDANLPTKAKIKGKIENLHRWDQNRWGTLDFTWNQIVPFLLHNDPILREKAEKIKKSKDCEYANTWLDGEGLWEWDIVEYQKIPVKGKWAVEVETSTENLVGTTRYQVTVRYRDQVIDSPGRIISKSEVKKVDDLKDQGQTEEEACKKVGIRRSDYIQLTKVEKVDKDVKDWLHNLSQTLNERKAYIEYTKAEIKACKKAGIKQDDYKRLKSNLRIEDCVKRGINPTVHRISVRSDNPNKYISYIDAYKKVPWIYGSAPNKGPDNPKRHQTELFVGFDCADFAVGAARAAKITNTEYTYADSLAKNKNLTEPVIEGPLYAQMEGKTLVIKRAKGRARGAKIDIPFGSGKSKAQIGDLILFDWDANNKKYDHTTIIYNNKSAGAHNKNELNKDTLTIYAGHDKNKQPQSGALTEPLEDMVTRKPTPWFVIRRWKKMPQEIYVLLSGFKPWATATEKVKWNSTQTVVEKLHGKTFRMTSKVKRKKLEVSVRVSSIVLPVYWYDAADTLIEEVKKWNHNIVVGLGMKSLNLDNVEDSDLKFEIEPLAHNQNDLTATDDRRFTPEKALQKRPISTNMRSYTRDPKKVKDDGNNQLLGSKTKNRLPYSEIADAINKYFPKMTIGKLTSPTESKEKNINREIKGFAYVDMPPTGTNVQPHLDRYGTSGYICNQVNYNLLYYNSLPNNRDDRFQHDVMAGFVHVPALDPETYEKKLIDAVEIMVKVCAKKCTERIFTK